MISARRAKSRIGFDFGGDRAFDLAQLGPDRLGDRGQRLGDDGRRAMLALLLDPIFRVFQGRPSRNQPVDLVACGIVRLGLAVGKRLGEPGDRVGVDRIVLGQPSGRFGEVANPFRVHDPDFDTGRAQRFRPAALVTAARLHHRPADPVRAHPRHQPGPAFRRARRRQAQSLRTNAGVDFALCDIQADKSRLLWHPPLPSLLVRALAPMQLFGFKEDARPVPRSLTGSGLRGSRAQIRRRAVASTAARSPNLPHSPDTRGVAPSYETSERRRIR